ncbi:GntR family transcriptional regulator [Arthrobacter sp. NPDC093139]|uniref:GntR family transcriptional regulator n=1 Tax=Arthrobacter sp. NPDC093139 TaxID=3363945 RepID=UPI0037FCCDA5
MAPKDLFTLEGRPTAQLIADQLREQIVQGTFRPGQQINESAVASQLNLLSRGPLREAMQRLCQEGILISRRNRGVFVLELKAEDIREIYAVREAAEISAANSLLDGRPEQLKDTCEVLKVVVRDMTKQLGVTDWQVFARLDMQFHTSFIAGTGNSRLVRMYETLATESRMCIPNLAASYRSVDLLVQEHQNILDLLEAGDRKGLHEAIKRHMQHAVEAFTGTRQDTA